jgi:hypothetical protein
MSIGGLVDELDGKNEPLRYLLGQLCVYYFGFAISAYLSITRRLRSRQENPAVSHPRPGG